MSKKKTIFAAVVLLLIFGVGGAIAYFTDTETKTNTFTVGDVDISLSETLWNATDGDSDGVPDAAENMMPGDSVAKNPVITNDSDENAAYVFAKVEIPCASETDNSTNPATTTYEEIFTLGTIGSGWNLMTDGSCTLNTTTNKYVATKVYNYGDSSSMTSLAASASTPALFTAVTLNTNISGNETGLTGALDVVVTGYGIQTKGLTTATPATIWSNF